ncbi:MAG: 5-dehydro-2-deoxygluconokinase [Clostridium sp.]|jgi:5-dehydro-2-deoxygluconokinase
MNGLDFNKEAPLDFIAIGRIGVDLYPNQMNVPMEDTLTFVKSVGGSPANIAVGMARLGMKTGFVGKVADDAFGRYIINFFNKEGIDTSNVFVDKSGAVNGISLTEVKSPNECGVIMYRDNVADLKISLEDINKEYIKSSKIFLISGTALSKSPSREAVLLAVELARKNKVIVFLDIDYRAAAWSSIAEASVYYKLIAEKSDVVIGTREEFDVLEFNVDSGNNDDYKTAKRFFDYNAKIVIVKHGEDGSIAYTKSGEVYKGGIFRTKFLKTYGAGDSFASAFTYGVLQEWTLDKCLEFGAASASIVISRTKCAESMAGAKEIREYIENYKNSAVDDLSEMR